MGFATSVGLVNSLEASVAVSALLESGTTVEYLIREKSATRFDGDTKHNRWISFGVVLEGHPLDVLIGFTSGRTHCGYQFSRVGVIPITWREFEAHQQLLATLAAALGAFRGLGF